MKPPRIGAGDAAFSLVGVLVSVGILGIVAAVFSALATNGMKAAKEVEARGDREAIRRFLLASVSCSAVPATCTPGDAMPLGQADAKGLITPLLPVTGKIFYPYLVRAECNVAGNGVIVRARRVRKGSTEAAPVFQETALAAKLYSWTDDETLLLPSGVDLCSGVANGKWPKIVRCESRPSATDPTKNSTWDFHQSLIYPAATDAIRFDNGIGTGGMTTVAYYESTGAAKWMMWRTGWGNGAIEQIINTPSGTGVYAAPLVCPPALRMDGRAIDSVFDP